MMLYVLAFVFPPLAVLLCGRPFLAVVTVFFTIAGWFPGVIVALLVVSGSAADARNAKVVRAINQRGSRYQ